MGIVKQTVCMLSRRTFGRLLAGAVLARPANASPLDADRLTWNVDATPDLSLERRYRADAFVLLLGVPVLHREAVGGGSVIWREFGTDRPTRLLEFNGFSSPERAAGLNRMGFIREMARTGVRDRECLYFGLMTSSPEESAEAARKALHSTAKEQAYTAIDARMQDDASETAIAHFTAPAAMSASHTAELMNLARQALGSVEKAALVRTRGEYSPSFLQVLAELLSRPDRQEGRYFYSGRSYRLGLTRADDMKATVRFRERGLIAAPAKAVRISGRLRREAGGKETEFRLWISDAAARPLPLSIEYRAKSYLRLVFEMAAG